MPYAAPATGTVFIRRRFGAEVRSARPEVSVPPVLVRSIRCGSMPYYEQETNYTCGPAVAQMGDRFPQWLRLAGYAMELYPG